LYLLMNRLTREQRRKNMSAVQDMNLNLQIRFIK